MFILRIYLVCSRRCIIISIDGTSYKVEVESRIAYPSRHMSSPPVFSGVCVAHLFSFSRCPIMCIRSEFRVVMYVTISA